MWLKYMHDSREHEASEGESVYFSHIQSSRVLTIMFCTLVVESIVGISVKLWSTW